MNGWQQKQVWLVAAVIAVVVLGLAVWVMRGGRDALSPAVEKLVQARSFHTESALVLHLAPRTGEQERAITDITSRLHGEVKRADDNIPEVTGKFFFEAKGRGNLFSAEGQVRILRDRVLFYVDSMPVFLDPRGNLAKRWTESKAALLTTNNSTQVREVLAGTLASMPRVGNETIEGMKLQHYRGTISEEHEQQLADVLRQSVSGNRAFHVIARLLDEQRLGELHVWVNPKKDEIWRIQADFIRDEGEQQGETFATLTMTFIEYGKDIQIDAPDVELTTEPRVFDRLFSGEVFGVGVETN